jgi:hypothetical protein
MSGSVAAQEPTRTGIWQLVLLSAVMVGVYVLAFLSQRWILIAFYTLTVLGAIVLGFRSRAMELSFDVGSAEKHRVVFRFSKFWGTVDLDVDDEPVVRDMRIFSVSHTQKYLVSVGMTERHEVRIEKDRSAVFAGARRQPVRAYVDDILVAEGVA